MRRPFALLALLALLSGCDLFEGEEPTVIEARGRVVLAETGEPVVGLGVALFRLIGGAGGAFVIESVRTDADGHFVLRYDDGYPGSSGGYVVEVNADPYDSHYGIFRRSIGEGQEIDYGTIEIERIEVP